MVRTYTINRRRSVLYPATRRVGGSSHVRRMWPARCLFYDEVAYCRRGGITGGRIKRRCTQRVYRGSPGLGLGTTIWLFQSRVVTAGDSEDYVQHHHTTRLHSGSVSMEKGGGRGRELRWNNDVSRHVPPAERNVQHAQRNACNDDVIYSTTGTCKPQNA